MQGIEDLSDAERKMLLGFARGLDRIMLILLFETGLEVEDLINLRVSGVDLKSGSLRVSPHRTIQLSAAALSELDSYLQSRPPQAYLMEGRCGKPVTRKWKRCVLEQLLLRRRGCPERRHRSGNKIDRESSDQDQARSREKDLK